MSNLYFDMAAILSLTVVIISNLMQNVIESVHRKRYVNMIFTILLTTIIDFFADLTCDYTDYFPIWFNIFLNSLLFMQEAIVGYSFVRYVESFITSTKDSIRRIWLNHAILIGALAVLIWNGFSGFLFYFNEQKQFTEGKLYFCIYVVCLYFFLYGDVLLYLNRKSLSKREQYSIFLITPFVLIGAFIQGFINAEQHIILFMTSQGAILLLFFMETPDYHKLKVTMEQLEKEREAAFAASKAKTQFLANMSHEIRTPINAVLGMDEMILRKSNDSEIKDYAEDIKDAANTLLVIVNDLLDMSKIEEKKMELIPTNYLLSSLIKDVVNMNKSRAAAKGLQFQLEIDPKLPSELYGDDNRLKQILNNLLSNAVKYTKEGSVLLKMGGSIQNQVLLLDIEVKDTGIGIKEEDINRLFEKFTRIEEKKNRNIEGTGLGLNITTELLKMMGSRLLVKSEYGKGSRFFFQLKQSIVNEEEIGSWQENLPEKRVAGTDNNFFTAPKAKILVVDDNRVNIKVFKSLLKDTQMQIDEAFDGMECLEKTEQKKYDLIFLDYMMPGMNGMETLHKLRETTNSPNQNTPVISLTADALKGTKEKHLSEGFDAYLAKPILPHELARMLLELLPERVVEYRS